MKSVFILLVISIFATPKESFAETSLGNGLLIKITEGLGAATPDTSDIQREKANARSNIGRVTTDVLKWIDDQCVRQKCEWTIPKTHIDRCKSAVRDIKNCIATEDKNMGSELAIIHKSFESATRDFEKCIPKASGKNQACRQLMAKIHAMLCKMQTETKKESDQCARSVAALCKKKKGLL